jgi:uncharacterized protein YndB with AHSA1/START domain
MDGYVVSTERVIPADAATIFDYLADASKHPLIDGSGTVKQAKDAPQRLVLGSVFGMKMKVGISYSMVNTVVEFEENRRIAWQARPGGIIGRVAAGRIWRYELEPTEGGTKVTESWDISQDKQRAFLRLGKLGDQTRENMDKTLARIEELTTS